MASQKKVCPRWISGRINVLQPGMLCTHMYTFVFSISGYMRDATGSYTMVYICAAVTSAVGGGFFLAANCARKCTRPQPREEQEQNNGIQIAVSTFNNSSKEEVHQ